MKSCNDAGVLNTPDNPRLSYLYNLLSPHEIEAFSETLAPGDTPLWELWEAFITKSLILGKSPLTLKGTRDTLKYLIRHTGVVSIEEMNRPGVLDDHLFRLQADREFSLNTRRSYIKNLNTYFSRPLKIINHMI
jgi:hypothetical protein